MLMKSKPESVAGTLLHPYIRFFNAVPGEDMFTFYLDGESAGEVGYGTFGRYIRTEQGEHTITLGKEGQTIAQLSLPISGNEVFTVAAIGTGDDIKFLPVPEPTDRNKLNVSNFRIANFSPDLPDVDIFANGFPILQDVQYPEVSRYIYLKPNSYTYRVNLENSGDVLLTVPEQSANTGKYYTMYLIGEATGNVPLSAVISLDAASYMGEYL